MNQHVPRRRRTNGDGFLGLLGDSARKIIDCSRVMAVFAHPDDETIAIGGQLSRLSGIRLLHVTDGAPASMADVLANGFSRREAYAAARRAELESAVREAGIHTSALLNLGAVDQQAAFDLPALANRLRSVFLRHRTVVVITHAFEGGHPDHDATAFIVHSACQMMKRQGAASPVIVECPFYHARNRAFVVQEFAGAPNIEIPETSISLDPEAAQSKRRMLSAHRTQQRTLAAFGLAHERFRKTPRYDFSQLPNGGELLYEQFDWGLDGAQWLHLATQARREFGLPQWF